MSPPSWTTVRPTVFYGYIYAMQTQSSSCWGISETDKVSSKAGEWAFYCLHSYKHDGSRNSHHCACMVWSQKRGVCIHQSQSNLWPLAWMKTTWLNFTTSQDYDQSSSRLTTLFHWHPPWTFVKVHLQQTTTYSQVHNFKQLCRELISNLGR